MSKHLQSTKRKYLAAAVLWGILIAVTSMEPRWVVRRILREEIYFCIAHFVCYGILTFSFCIYLRFKRVLFAHKLSLLNVLALAFFISAVWGGFLEWAQKFSDHRMSTWEDFFMNVYGSLGGLLFYLAFSRFMKNWGHARLKPVEIS
jgi:glycopeptide antibiotics resistance protein